MPDKPEASIVSRPAASVTIWEQFQIGSGEQFGQQRVMHHNIRQIFGICGNPVTHRYGETPASCGKLFAAGNFASSHFFKRYFPVLPCSFNSSGKVKAKSDIAISRKRRPAFQTMCHQAGIQFNQQIIGQIFGNVFGLFALQA